MTSYVSSVCTICTIEDSHLPGSMLTRRWQGRTTSRRRLRRPAPVGPLRRVGSRIAWLGRLLLLLLLLLGLRRGSMLHRR